MDVKHVVAAQLVAHLAQRFQEGQRLDIADRAADLDQHDLGAGGLGDQADAALDLVGDMRDDLDGAAQVIAAALFADHLGIDLPGGDVADPVQADVDKALVMTQVQVGLRAIIQHVHLAMLVGAHRAGIDIDIGVQLLDCHGKAALFEQPADGGCGNAFANRANHPTGKENIFWCPYFLL